jgi:hypothetical protein
MRTGITVDQSADELVVVHQEDVEKVLDINRRAYNRSSDMVRRGEEWNHWARIPPGIAMMWKAEFGIDILNEEHWQAVVKKLHDPDWRYLRTAQGNYQQRTAREYFRGSSSPTARTAPDAAAISRIGKAGMAGRVQRRGSFLGVV